MTWTSSDGAVDDAVGEGSHHEASRAEMKEGPAPGRLLQQCEPGLHLGHEPLTRDRATAEVEAQAVVEIALRLRVEPNASFGHG